MGSRGDVGAIVGTVVAVGAGGMGVGVEVGVAVGVGVGVGRPSSEYAIISLAGERFGSQLAHSKAITRRTFVEPAFLMMSESEFPKSQS